MRTRAEQIAVIRRPQFGAISPPRVGPARTPNRGRWARTGDMAGHLVGGGLDDRPRGRRPPGGSMPAADDDDAINVWIHDQHAGRSAGQLVADYDGSYDRLVRALEALPDAMLATVIEWIGEPLVNADFTDHLHDEHVPSVRAWLDGHPR